MPCTTEFIKDRLLKMASRCAKRERVKKVDAAMMMREAYDLIGRLEAEITSLTACPKCKGRGRVWLALYGDSTCLDCRGTGRA